MIIDLGGWYFFTGLPNAANSGWLVLFPFMTIGAFLLGIIGLVITILGLVLKAKTKE